MTFVPRRSVVPVASRSRDGSAPLVSLLVDLSVPPDLEIEPLRQRVHHGDADAMQTARHFVAVVVEFAACMQNRKGDFGCGLSAGMPIDRNTTTVVDDSDRVVDVNGDAHLVAVASECFVDRIVDNLIDEVVQSGSASRPDVHGWAFADRFKAFENLDFVRAVIVD